MPTPLDPELVAQIRESLHAGRGVRLFGDEPPVAKLDVLTPMTAEGEAFLDGKLEKVAELLERGFIVNIDSDGSILARTPDNGSRYLSTQESEIDAMDRIMVRTALERGATVAIEADGSLVINAAATPTTVPAATAAAQFAEFERLADSGAIGTELTAGRDFNFDAAAVTAPVAPAPLEDPFDTAAEVAAEADSLQMGVDVARDLSRPEFVARKEQAEADRAEAERQLARTTAERDVAERQAAAARAEAISVTETAAAKRAEAIEAAEKGDVAEAAAANADADNVEAIALVHSRSAESAQREFDDADQRVTAETEELDRLTVASQEVNNEFSRLETVLDAQESQVFYAREAAKELAEVERLEAALPDMEARGVAGLDRVRAAIAEHRATAETYVEKGNLGATTGIVVTDHDATDPEVAEPTVDPAVPDVILTDPDVTDPDVTDPDVTDPDDNSPVSSEPNEGDPDRPGGPASSADEPDIIDFGESTPSSEPIAPYPDPIYPTMADPAHNDPDIIDMDDDRPWTPLEVEPDDTVVLDIAEQDNAAPQFEERLDDINELSQDLDELTD